MKVALYLAAAFLVLASCGGKDEPEAVKLTSFKDRISYAMGADHAGQLVNSGDPNFENYDKDQIIKGFEIGLKDENAFDEGCQRTLENLVGPTRQGFDPAFKTEGSLCIGKVLGTVFISGWKKNQSLDKFDLEKVKLGFDMALKGVDTLIEKTERSKLVQDFITELNNKLAAKVKRDEAPFFEKVKAKGGIQELPEGLLLETLSPGKGGKPNAGDDVQVDYAVMNMYGDTIESSLQAQKMGRPMPAFSLNGVVRGWQLGFPYMTKGGAYKLYVPTQLAYGEEPLVFYIRLNNYGKPGTLTSQKPGM